MNAATPWLHFPATAAVAIALWLLAVALQIPRATRDRVAFQLAAALGALVLAAFAAAIWHALARPPMRTLGETRLWYSIFTPLIGIAVCLAFRQRWLLNYALGMGALFLVIDLLHPEAYNKSLMPALQSVWFVPHVLVYIFAYAIFAASSAVAVHGLWKIYFRKTPDSAASGSGGLPAADRLVYLGLGFLTLGLLFGALWAKEAWGHYWTWDPKETWAMLTWLGYLAYIHVRHHHPGVTRPALWVLALSFVILLVCWFGVNYLPSAALSVHTYTQQ